MNVIVDIAIIPIGIGLSLSAYVAECERIFSFAGLEPRLHPNGTDIEGEWDVVMDALKKCHERPHDMGAPGSRPISESAPGVIGSRAWTTRWNLS